MREIKEIIIIKIIIRLDDSIIIWLYYSIIIELDYSIKIGIIDNLVICIRFFRLFYDMFKISCIYVNW